MAKSKKLKKPVKKTDPAYYDFNEVMHYLEQLHGKNFRDYAGKYGHKEIDESVPYQDFWHWICDLNEITNGGRILLPDWEYYMNLDRNTEPWKKEIMQYFYDFLGEDYHKEMRVSW